VDYSFHIEDSYTPKTIPMERLGEYLTALAQLLGETANVHLGDVVDGCVALEAIIDTPAQVKVAERVKSVGSNAPIKDAQKAFEMLDELLRRDNATGSLRDAQDRVVIPFMGKDKRLPPVFGPFKQDGTLTGQVVRVGGKDATVPILLRDGSVYIHGITADEDMARRLAPYYLGPTIRIHGVGSWLREVDGTWKLKGFDVTGFEQLDEAPLGDVVSKLRAVRGSSWGDVPDPVAELLEDRRMDGASH
jgi:hypothetical protein